MIDDEPGAGWSPEFLTRLADAGLPPPTIDRPPGLGDDWQPPDSTRRRLAELARLKALLWWLALHRMRDFYPPER